MPAGVTTQNSMYITLKIVHQQVFWTYSQRTIAKSTLWISKYSKTRPKRLQKMSDILETQGCQIG